MTQTDISNLLGVKQSTVAMRETGASIPRTKDLKKIAKILNTSIDKLIESFEVEQ